MQQPWDNLEVDDEEGEYKGDRLGEAMSVAFVVGLLSVYFFLACFTSFCLRAYWKLGYVPTFDHPDPKMLEFHQHRDITFFSMLWIAVSGAALIYIGFRWLLRKPVGFIQYWQVALAIAGMFAALWTFTTEWMNWFLD